MIVPGAGRAPKNESPCFISGIRLKNIMYLAFGRFLCIIKIKKGGESMKKLQTSILVFLAFIVWSSYGCMHDIQVPYD